MAPESKIRAKSGRLAITQIARHRNGISGEPFYVVTFRCPDNGPMIATVFEAPGHVAVLKLDLLPDVTFAVNSWRGDHYEADLRAAIEKHDAP